MQEPPVRHIDTTGNHAAMRVASGQQGICVNMEAATAVTLLETCLYLSMTTREHDLLMHADCSVVRIMLETHRHALQARIYSGSGCRVSLVRQARRDLLTGRDPC